MTPIPTFEVTDSRACADSRWDGIADNELGVTCNHNKEESEIPIAVSVIAKVVFGLETAILVKKSKLLSSNPLNRFEESPPKCFNRIGCNEAAAAIETSGTTKQANPNERTNGIGTKTRVANPNATVSPEITAVRPAVCMVCSIRSKVKSRLCRYR